MPALPAVSRRPCCSPSARPLAGSLAGGRAVGGRGRRSGAGGQPVNAAYSAEVCAYGKDAGVEPADGLPASA
jgi:hypothetical protein